MFRLVRSQPDRSFLKRVHITVYVVLPKLVIHFLYFCEGIESFKLLSFLLPLQEADGVDRETFLHLSKLLVDGLKRRVVRAKWSKAIYLVEFKIGHINLFDHLNLFIAHK